MTSVDFWNVIWYKCGCWCCTTREVDGVAQLCKYHDDLAAAEELMCEEPSLDYISRPSPEKVA